MVAAHRETERKYEAGSAVLTLPSLAGLPRVASVSAAEQETLEAGYYDTDDLRLIRSGVTLRRRRGGHDEGWHLKLPAGRDSRWELRHPLEPAGSPAGSEVPGELADLAWAYRRGRPLRPVAHLTTVRSRRILADETGSSLAEVVTDDVSAQTLGRVTAITRWQEVEFELTGGDEDLLEAADQRLRGAGLRPAGYSAKLERALAGLLPPGASAGPSSDGETRPDDRPTKAGPTGSPGPRGSTSADTVLVYLRNVYQTMQGFDPQVRRDAPDSVHQMRVAIRRLRSTLQSFGAILRPEATAHLRDELKWLGTVLGESRDAEVMDEQLQAWRRQEPAGLVMGPVAARIRAHLAPRQAGARRALLDALRSDRYAALLDNLDRLLEEPPLTGPMTRTPTGMGAAPARDELTYAVGQAYRRVRRRMRRAQKAPAGREREIALHETRKAAKRARYAAEAVQPVFGRPARKFARRMKRMQSVLGEHQDAVVIRATARDLGVAAFSAGENAFPYGLLYGREDAATISLQHRARRVWKQSSRRKHRHWLG
ncbi:MAG TPA: CYTH and CHAD domain-containing protein [Streptosporangiaceae bacterium]|nr:CYTH and CHAD domain-containing protein [Streptosporangiaceae bacterium]